MATIDELMRRFGNIGQIPAMPSYTDGMSALDRAQATPMFTNADGSQVPYLAGPDGTTRVALTDPADPAGAGGVYGNWMGTFAPDGTMQGADYTRQERSGTWLDSNPWATLLLPLGGAALGSLGGMAPAASAGELSAMVTPAAETLPAGFSGAGDLMTLSSSGAAPAVGAAGGESIIGNAAAGLFDGGTKALATSAMPTVANAALGAAGAGGILGALGGMRGAATLAGGLAGALGSKADPVTASQSVPEWALPYAQDILGRAQAIGDTPFQPYAGQRYAGPNDAQRTSWEMVNQMARNPAAQQTQAEGTYARLTSGERPTFGQTERVSNQYIGQTTPGASNQYIGQTTGSNVSSLVNGQSNPYLGKETQQIGPLGQMSLAQTTTDVGRNPLLGLNNPYLNDAIRYASDDVTRNFNNVVNPQFDRMARASGSFGNTGVEQARAEAQRNLANELGRVSSNMRMQDYGLQAQLGESDIGRRVSTSLADAQRNLGASQAQQQFNIGTDAQRQQFNAGLQAQDLARNLAGAEGANSRLLDAAKFDTSMRNNDITRNAGLMQDLSKFNSGLLQNDLSRNANLTNAEQQFNAGQGNINIANDINTWNAAESRAASTLPQWTGFNDARWRGAQALNTVGNQMMDIANQPLNFNFEEFMRQINQPRANLDAYRGGYGTSISGNSTSTQSPSAPNPIASAMGGATGFAALYDILNRPRY